MHLMNLLKVCQNKSISYFIERGSCLCHSVSRQLSSISLYPSNFFRSDVKYAVKDITEGAEYEFRVSAINESGSGEPSPPSALVCAKNPNSKLPFP